MRRLALIIAVLVAGVAAIPPVVGQVLERSYRLGVLAPGDSSSWPVSPLRTITLSELARLGFVEGRNLAVDVRYGSAEALPGLARDLAATEPDAIVAVSAAAIHAARRATNVIPVVMSFIGEDPVEGGLAASLARPGGNVTGLVMLAPELDGKRLHLLHETLPGARRIAALMMDRTAREDQRMSAIQDTAARIGIELLVDRVGSASDYPRAFAAMRAAGAEGLVITSAPELFRDTEPLVALAIEHALPMICEWREMAARGCLLGYGPSLVALRRRTADYVARVFRGTPPGEMPIEQPTEFEFAVNLRTARALGIELPPAILARADEVIE